MNNIHRWGANCPSILTAFPAHRSPSSPPPSLYKWGHRNIEKECVEEEKKLLEC